MRQLGLVVVLGVALVMLAACGGNGAAQPTPTRPAATATAGDGDGGQDNGDPAAERGKKIVQANCLTCHTTDGRELVGPTWKGLYGKDVKMEDGSVVTADDAYIRESIVDPNAKVVEGYPAVMPNFKTLFDKQQLDDIVAYIKTL